MCSAFVLPTSAKVRSVENNMLSTWCQVRLQSSEEVRVVDYQLLTKLKNLRVNIPA